MFESRAGDFFVILLSVVISARPVDRLISEWVAPAMRDAGFKRKGRSFYLTPEPAIDRRLQFRMHPLYSWGDSFFVEYDEYVRLDILPQALGLPTAQMVYDPDRGRYPGGNVAPHIWWIAADEVDLIGAWLVQDLHSTWIPLWTLMNSGADQETILAAAHHASRTMRQPWGQGGSDINRVSRSLWLNEPAELEDTFTRLHEQWPENRWVEWWQARHDAIKQQ